ncbi:AtpZ/AtpI family protein [Polaribacter sp.]|jgi:F0F1-type ATP synthase assembly protein I|uniref:AtpZ/AtpI family protein n=1 Tax=Polaribacter sp. TaxID=1920175 RepID=UPI003AE2696E
MEKEHNKTGDTNKKETKEPLNKVLRLTGITAQMGVTIYLFVLLGKWLDATYNNNEKGFIIVTTLVGVAVSLYLVIKQTNKLNQ